LYGISKFPLTLYPLPEGRGRGEGAKFLYGISKFPLTLYPLPEGRGRGEGANLFQLF